MTTRKVGRERAKDLAENTDVLNCGLCLNHLKKPKFLNCEHSYCEQCLISITSPHATSVVCPKCDTETPYPEPEKGLGSIPTNPYIQDILNEYYYHMKYLYQIDPSIQKCESCDSGDRAVACCLTCEEYLCTECETAHKKLNPVRGHNVEQIDWVPYTEMKLKTQECNTHPGRAAIFSCSCCNKRICIECVGINYEPEEVENYKNCHRKIEHQNQTNLDSKLEVANSITRKRNQEEDGGVPPDPVHSAVSESDLRKIMLSDMDLDDMKAALSKRAQEQINRVEKEERELVDEINVFEMKHLMIIRRYKDKNRARALKCLQILSIARNLANLDCHYVVVSLHQRLVPLLQKCRVLDFNSFEEDVDILSLKPDEMRLVDPSKLIGRVDCLMTFQAQWGADGKPCKRQLNWGHGIAVYPSGDVAICDRSGRRVIIYTCTGQVQYDLMSPPEKSKHRLNTPCDAAVTSNGFLLVVDCSNRVKIFDEKGLFLRAFITQSPHETPEENVSLVSVAVDDRDRIAVADYGRSLITLHYKDGVLIRQIRCKCRPGFITINSQYQILISAYPHGKVEVMDYEGNLLFWMNVMIEGRKHKIGGIMVDTQNNIWVGVHDSME